MKITASDEDGEPVRVAEWLLAVVDAGGRRG